ncbi:MAG: hypothetical protein WBP44_08000 [Gammaproteobacteria bacterium]
MALAAFFMAGTFTSKSLYPELTDRPEFATAIAMQAGFPACISR